jgi:site-specific DNA-methyltransferase (adenine-specific)
MTNKPYTLLQGDCLEVMRGMADNSVDAIVTDPPYGLSKEPNIAEVMQHWINGDVYEHKGAGFMGKSWDSFVPSPAYWKEAMRVLKPGGHALVFAGTRTQDLMTISLRFAGFEIRDSIRYLHNGEMHEDHYSSAWVFGSGFPKSANVSKLIDARLGKERTVTGENKWSHKRKIDGVDTGNCYGRRTDTPASEPASVYDGWGSALKPAYEPIILARKPLEGTIAENVLKYGAGGINIDGCRVGETGRFPANLIHDGSDEVVSLFPHGKSGGSNGVRQSSSNIAMSGKNYARVTEDGMPPNSGSASRFFYCAKASKKDRDEGLDLPYTANTTFDSRPSGDFTMRLKKVESPALKRNNHPTVKPTSLMCYLVRLITPPNGTVLDPFAGSGSTGKAAMLEGFNFIGIEREPEYIEIARQRIEAAIP